MSPSFAAKQSRYVRAGEVEWLQPRVASLVEERAVSRHWNYLAVSFAPKNEYGETAVLESAEA